jgi:NitT/TauT family transport system substrate-binding protein
MFRIASVALIFFTLAIPVHGQTRTRLLYGPSVNSIAIFVAEDQGYFKSHGLDVELNLGQNASTFPAALVSASADVAAPTVPNLFVAIEQGLDLVVVAGGTAYSGTTQSGIIAAPNSGIRTAADLVNHRVAIAGFGTTIDILTKKWVQASGADFRRVNWVELPLPQMGDALKSGLVDAISTVDPFLTRVLDSKLGDNIASSGTIQPLGTQQVVFATTRAWALAHVDTLTAFRAVLDEAAAYILRDPAHAEAVIASLAKWTKLPPQSITASALPARIDVHPTPDSLRFFAEACREQGLLNTDPDLNAIIMASP